MHCPHCKNEYHCGCEACKPRNEAKGYKVQIYVGDDKEACPHCGLTMSIDDWADEEFRQYDALRDKEQDT